MAAAGHAEQDIVMLCCLSTSGSTKRFSVWPDFWRFSLPLMDAGRVLFASLAFPFPCEIL